ncbi:PQQ-binding-like beta-propeller repeat protein [uncultured Rubinisphaera sp.]|uniref:outer membrane protein assembly factor BamB family protein n=1 Tax=uncultured Rubinisphaera sp. TaxID=1678686 RepID=UPI0030D70339
MDKLMSRGYALSMASCLLLSFLTRIAIGTEPVPVNSKTDWPCWRGADQNGIAAEGQQPPLEWSETENVIWKTPVTGRGHGSPIVVGNQVILATADEAAETRSLISFNRNTGKKVWETILHSGKATPARNKKGTQASSTPACDGERLFINFLHDGQMVTSAVGMNGKILWQQPICEYIVHQGYGSSPTLFKDLIIVSADNKAGGAIAGLDRETGKIIWKQDRPEMPNYPSPIILNVAGKTQLIMTGCELVTGMNPQTGEKLWEIEGATTECVTSTPTNGELVYSSGGYPKNHVAAYKADGSGEVAWEIGTRIYVPSMLVKENHLYAIADAGIAYCLNASTGEELWKGRLSGTFTSSPVIVNNVLMATNEAGETFVINIDSDEFELLGRNQLGEESFATPVVCDSKIFMRVASKIGDERKEFLYCLGKKQ